LRVRQILINLLSNAIKFSRPPAGAATVGAALRSDGWLAISVADNGIGMTEAGIAIARQPFRQIDTSFARTHDGAGLGLALVDGFMAAHGGTLEIVSTPSVGTTVTVAFPPERVIAS
jgi:signal transduction histidine kinase